MKNKKYIIMPDLKQQLVELLVAMQIVRVVYKNYRTANRKLPCFDTTKSGAMVANHPCAELFEDYKYAKALRKECWHSLIKSK